MRKLLKFVSFSLVSVILLASTAGCSPKKGVTSLSQSSDSFTSTDSLVISEDINSSIANEDTSETSLLTVSSTNPGSSKPTNTSSPSQTVATADLTGRVSNLNGRVVKVNITPNTDKTTPDYKATQAWYRVVEQKYNCKIEEVSKHSESGGSNEITKSILAGKPLVDIWWQNGIGDIFPHYRAGLIQNLDSLKVFDFSDKGPYPESIDYVTFGGNHYFALPGRHTGAAAWNAQVMFFNSKIVSQYAGYSVAQMYQLQNSGEWTWDKFSEICKTINRNTKSAGVDVTACYDWNIASQLLGSSGTDWVQRKDDGTYFSNISDSKIQTSLDLFKRMSSDGTFTLSTAVDINAAFGNGKLAFMPLNLYAQYWWIFANGTADVRNNYGTMYIPKQSGSASYYTYTNSVNSLYGEAIPYGIKNPNEIATILDQLMQQPSLPKADDKATFESNYISTLNTATGSYVKLLADELYENVYTYKNLGPTRYSDVANYTSPVIGELNYTKDSFIQHAFNYAQGKENLDQLLGLNNMYNTLLSTVTKKR